MVGTCLFVEDSSRGAGVQQLCLIQNIAVFEPCHEKTCFLLYVNDKTADQPVHPRSLISVFVVRCLDRIIPILAISKISRLMLVNEAGQVGLSHSLSETPNRFSRDTAHVVSG